LPENYQPVRFEPPGGMNGVCSALACSSEQDAAVLPLLP
jgi:hypothetical protein